MKIFMYLQVASAPCLQNNIFISSFKVDENFIPQHVFCSDFHQTS